jgi:transglutaminase-like putative cysteine protease
MLIRLGYDIQFDIPAPVAMVALLYVHPSRAQDLLEPDELQTEPALAVTNYVDSFGNRCARFLAQPGLLRLSSSTLIRDTGLPDTINPSAGEVPVEDLPNEVLSYLLNSRYCEVDRFSNIAYEHFGHLNPGWSRVQYICNWVHSHVAFNYQHARPTKTALDVYTERVGVCRDFQHLAITFCRALNIPARYATGYLGDIGVPVVLPMDFSAWFEVWLEGQWWTFDARNNQPRIGRVLMATGRDASDVAMTTSFGRADLRSFFVVSEEEAAAALTPSVVEPHTATA